MKSQIKKILCLCAAVCLMVSCIVIPTSAAEASATISFASKSDRTEYSTSKQVWVKNGITVTNNKSTSTSNVGDYANPGRFYKNTEVIISYGQPMTKIVFNAPDATYAGNLKRSIGAAATASGSQVTVVLATPATSFTFKCTDAQCRMSSLTVYYDDGGSQGGGGTTPPPVNPPFDPTGKTAAQIVEAAYELTGSETIDNATVEGTITAINTPYDSGYKNITFTISVEGSTKTIKCYRVTADPDKLTTLAGVAVGDKVTVQGNIVVYSGAPQFAQGTKMIAFEAGNVTPPAAPEDPKEIVDEAFALASGAQLPYKATLTGKVVSIDTEYSDQFKNITVTIEVEGTNAKRNLQCFRLKGADGVDASTLAVDDVITVTGDIINYSGKIQFNAGATYVMATVDNGNNQGGGNPSTGVENFVFGAMAMAIAAAAVVVATGKKDRA